jgi:hypothetical protein
VRVIYLLLRCGQVSLARRLVRLLVRKVRYLASRAHF